MPLINSSLRTRHVVAILDGGHPMGRAARKLADHEDLVVRARPRGATSLDAPHDSPARLLQDELSARIGGAEKPDWSPRRTAAFIVLTSTAGWSLIAGAVMLALR